MAESASLVLASRSRARGAMLRSVGLAFSVVPADVGEAVIRDEMLAAGKSPRDIAIGLACAKASSVSEQYPGMIVIGSDQILAVGNDLLSKAESVAEARATLYRLRNRTHELISAVAIARDGGVLWHTADRAMMTMRDFSDAFLTDYLARAGEGVLHAVGCYELEALGIQLFERIEGDYFTILGMPLLQLLVRLREEKVLMA